MQVPSCIRFAIPWLVLGSCSNQPRAEPAEIRLGSVPTASTSVPDRTIVAETQPASVAAPSLHSPRLTAAPAPSLPLSAPLTTLGSDPNTASSVEPLVRQAVLDFFAAYQRCGEEPANCEPQSILAPGSEAAERLQTSIEEMVKNGFWFDRQSPRLAVTVNEVNFISSASALVATCLVDSIVVLGPPDQSGRPISIDADVVRRSGSHRVDLVQGRWLLAWSAYEDESIESCS